MNICEMCGAANGKLESACRICGHSFAEEPETVSAQSAPATAVTYESVDAPPELQVSSVRQAQRTGTPPMLGNAAPQEPAVPETGQKTALPSFMQEGSRAQAPAQESVSLISANDLPEWIRQIAEADAAKAAAEAEAALEAPAAGTKPTLPASAPVTGPSTTSWLSKGSAATDSDDHWAESPASTQAWGTAGASGDQSQPAYPTLSPSDTYMPSLHELSAASARKRRFSRGARSSSSGTPVYQNRVVQLAALVLLLALLAAMVL